MMLLRLFGVIDMSVWSGKGLPPVGTVCRVVSKSTTYNVVAEIIHYHGCRAWIGLIGNGEVFKGHNIIYKDKFEFRVFESEEDKAINDMQTVLENAYQDSSDRIPNEIMCNAESLDFYLRALYRAGYRKQDEE